MRWHLDLSGMYVFITPDAPATDDDVAAALADLGAVPEIRPHLGVCLPVAQLRRLESLRSDIVIVPSEGIHALWQLVSHPAPASLPATVVRASERSLLIEWMSDATAHECYLDVSAALALLATEIPFVATPDAWDLIDAATRSTPVTGRVTLHLDGFFEITSSRPQLVEALDLPGLFRLDATHFGLSLVAKETLLNAQQGLIIDEIPPLEVPPPTPPTLELAGHHLADLENLAATLYAYQAQVICWESGLGRRVFALAAIDRIDAWPVMIVTSPSQLWAWQRHLSLVGRTHSLSHHDADAFLVTYHDIARRKRLPLFPSIIFDQLSSPQAHDAYPALRRLAGLRDTFRLSVESDWPTSPEDQIEVMEIVRPGEFRSDVPLAERYPPDATLRAVQHVDFYRSVRTRDDEDVDLRPFRRSSTRIVELSSAHRLAIDELSDRLVGAPAHQAIGELLETITAGPGHIVSPKLAAAVVIARKEMDKGRSCAIVTRSKKAATLLRSLLRPIPVDVTEPGGVPTPEGGRVAIVRFSLTWPDLRSFDHVVILDYPWSLSVVDDAVGPASAPGTDRVTLIHAIDTIEDRLALLASRRAESAGLTDATSPPTLEEISYLVTPRD